MNFNIIEIDTPAYQQMLDLRHRILRAPLGLEITKEELARDAEDTLLGAFYPNGGQLVACCVLSAMSNPDVIQLRQMAVEDFCQGKGVGGELIDYAEQVAKQMNCKWVYLHARWSAIDFYKKKGYTIESDIFTEVGIKHVEMMKSVEVRE